MAAGRNKGALIRRLTGAAVMLCLFWSVLFSLGECGEKAEIAQTPVATAEFSFENGTPMLQVEGIGKVEHPGFISMYALSYMGKERFYDFGVSPSKEYAANCIQWLKKHAEDVGDGMKGWIYSFDNTYNDVSIRAPWYSAFGQACGIEALVCWNEKTGDAEALKLAREAAEMLFMPIENGGLLFSSGGDIWFEEIPSKEGEPSHILNGHMRALLALRRLYDATGDKKYLDWYRRGAESLVRWMPLYDAGYWMRYDLNPRKSGLLFRFNNPYGEKLPELAVDEIRLEDPVSGKSTVIDVGGQGDMENSAGAYLAGVDWQVDGVMDGNSERRFVAAKPEPDVNAANTKPNCYFYLNLPSAWSSNLRRDWLKLTIRYKDEAPGDVVVEQRSIAPDEEFVAMRDGALLLTGSGEWREWSVPVRPQDLGWPVGMLYGEKHMQYLETLAADTPELSGWAEKARGYWNAARIKLDTDTMMGKVIIDEGKQAASMVMQNIIFPVWSADENGVILQHNITEGTLNQPISVDKGYYSPFMIASQVLGTISPSLEKYEIYKPIFEKYSSFSWILSPSEMPHQIPKDSAYRWLREHAVPVGNGVVWHMEKENIYNDLIQKAGWQSAFWQRYVIDAFIADNDENMVRRAALAYGIPTDKGGLCSSWGGQKGLWFEEVPNNSHILNAHLASIVALHRVNELYPNDKIKEFELRGMEDLRDNLYLYDTGYWTKYDMNPQKNILFALAWEGKEESPPLDDMYLFNPVINAVIRVDVGAEGDFEGASCLAGNLWRVSQVVDGRTTRSMAAQPVNDWSNAAFLHLALPKYTPQDDFLWPDHYFVLSYKDTLAGRWRIFRQSISEGNTLVMVPLPETTIICNGDGKWKKAVLRLPSQATGWFMGDFYQDYHAEQLRLIAEQTKDWYFSEICERWNQYLEAYKLAHAKS